MPKVSESVIIQDRAIPGVSREQAIAALEEAKTLLLARLGK
jgi:hypothetical protein